MAPKHVFLDPSQASYGLHLGSICIVNPNESCLFNGARMLRCNIIQRTASWSLLLLFEARLLPSSAASILPEGAKCCQEGHKAVGRHMFFTGMDPVCCSMEPGCCCEACLLPNVGACLLPFGARLLPCGASELPERGRCCQKKLVVPKRGCCCQKEPVLASFSKF